MAFLEISDRIELRWRDMDMLGHLNQAVYHELLEEARGDLVRRVSHQAAFVLAHVELDYLKEVRFEDGPVEVTTRVTEIGARKIVIAHEVRHSSGTVAAQGSSVLVCWDGETRSSRELTPDERTILGAP